MKTYKIGGIEFTPIDIRNLARFDPEDIITLCEDVRRRHHVELNLAQGNKLWDLVQEELREKKRWVIIHHIKNAGKDLVYMIAEDRQPTVRRINQLIRCEPRPMSLVVPSRGDTIHVESISRELWPHIVGSWLRE